MASAGGSGGNKRITCFFIAKGETISYTVDVEPNGEAAAIQKLIEEKSLHPYSLSFVIDNDNVTYQAEYLHSRYDFQSRQNLIPEHLKMETLINSNSQTPNLNRRIDIRNMTEDEWIEEHGSGTLRKNKRIGFSYRTQYLAERIAYEYGYGFQILPRSQITFGDPISEENCSAITEAGWHIERYMMMDIFGDKVEAKYIHAYYKHSAQKEGVGIIVRETSAPWVPTGHIIFALVAEFNPIKKAWEHASNPF